MVSKLSLALGIYCWAMSVVQAQEVEFVGESLQVAPSGYIQLDWSGEAEFFWLEQAEDSLFEETKVIYRGPDKASFVSGLLDGQYYYRVKANEGEWSNVLQVQVQHQSLNLALTLSGLGLLVFALTSVVIIKGSRSTPSTS